MFHLTEHELLEINYSFVDLTDLVLDRASFTLTSVYADLGLHVPCNYLVFPIKLIISV